VAFKDSVYDVTDFVKLHPGGINYIKLAAGSYLEPFMSFYDLHYRSKQFWDELKKHKVGELHPDDIMKEEDIPIYEHDPKHPVAEKSNT